MPSELVLGMLDNKWYCHGCGKEYQPHPDPSNQEEETLCPKCLKEAVAEGEIVAFMDANETPAFLVVMVGNEQVLVRRRERDGLGDRIKLIRRDNVMWCSKHKLYDRF